MTDYYIELRDVDIDGDGDTDNIQYHFDLIQNLDDNGNIPFTTIEASDSLNNQQLGFSGKTREIPIEWIIYDDGTDKSNGTWDTQVGSSFDSNLGADITTIEDQIYYLSRYIQNSTLGAQWRLFGGRFTDPDGDGTDEGTPVVVEAMPLRRLAENPTRASGTMKLKVGQGI